MIFCCPRGSCSMGLHKFVWAHNSWMSPLSTSLNFFACALVTGPIGTWTRSFEVVPCSPSERVLALPLCTATGKLWWFRLSRNWWVAVVFLLFLLTGLMRSFQPTLDCFYLLNLCWHMLGSRVGLPSLSGLRRIKGGYSMPMTIPLVGRRK